MKFEGMFTYQLMRKLWAVLNSADMHEKLWADHKPADKHEA